VIFHNFIYQPMFLRDAARPMPRPIPFERFGLAGSMKRITHNLYDKGVDFVKNLLVIYFPLPVFGKSGIQKTDHCFAACIACSSVSNATCFPSADSVRILSIRSRLAGVPSRYSVSSCSLTCISTTWSGYAVLIESIKVCSSSVVLSLYVVTIFNNRNGRIEIKQCFLPGARRNAK